jgi:hypothetical protein
MCADTQSVMERKEAIIHTHRAFLKDKPGPKLMVVHKDRGPGVRYRTEHASFQDDNCRDDKRPPEVRRAQQQEIDMNRDRFEGGWKQFGGKVKEQWGTLTDGNSRIS